MNSTLNKYDYVISDNTIDVIAKKSGISKLQVSYIDPVTGIKHNSNILEWNIPVKIKEFKIVNKDDAFSMRNVGDEREFHSRLIFDDDSYVDDPIGTEYTTTNVGVEWDATGTGGANPNDICEEEVIDKNGKRTFKIRSIRENPQFNLTGEPTIGAVDLRLENVKSEYFEPGVSVTYDTVTFRVKKKIKYLYIDDNIPENDEIRKIGKTKTFNVYYVFDDGSERPVNSAEDITWHIDNHNLDIVSFEGFNVTTNDSGKAQIYCTTESEGELITSNIVEWDIVRTLTELKINASHSIQKIIDTNEILINTDYYIPIQKIYDNNPNNWEVWDDAGTNIIWEVKELDSNGSPSPTSNATIEIYNDSNFYSGKFKATKKGSYQIKAIDAETGIWTILNITTVKDITSIEITPDNPNYGYYMNNEYDYHVLITYEDGTTSTNVNKVVWNYSSANAATFTVVDDNTMRMLLKTNTNGNIYVYDPRNKNMKSNNIEIDDAACIIKAVKLGLKKGSNFYTSPSTTVYSNVGLDKVGGTGIFDIRLTNNSGDCVHYGNPDMWEISGQNIEYTLDFPDNKNKAHLKRLINVTVTGTGVAKLRVKFKYDGGSSVLNRTYELSWNVTA